MAVLRRGLGSVLACAGLLLAAPAVLPAQVAEEYAVKAAFLYNFTKFVEWPEVAFPDGSFRLCVLGDDPFGKSLTELSGQEAAGRKLMVVRVQQMEKLEGCNLLFISRSERGRLSGILSQVEGSPVLTVADTPGFLEEGGTINFILEGSKIRFEISQEAAARAEIKISSKLMSLAKRVKSGPGPA
ncbi:MAG TPA: YfiR family protein [Thermoanaerobaculia bacterium]